MEVSYHLYLMYSSCSLLIARDTTDRPKGSACIFSLLSPIMLEARIKQSEKKASHQVVNIFVFFGIGFKPET